MKRPAKQIALATLVALATLIAAEAASARPLHQGTPQDYQDSDASYSRMIAAGEAG
jgi:hypothetical protein